MLPPVLLLLLLLLAGSASSSTKPFAVVRMEDDTAGATPLTRLVMHPQSNVAGAAGTVYLQKGVEAVLSQSADAPDRLRIGLDGDGALRFTLLDDAGAPVTASAPPSEEEEEEEEEPESGAATVLLNGLDVVGLVQDIELEIARTQRLQAELATLETATQAYILANPDD